MGAFTVGAQSDLDDTRANSDAEYLLLMVLHMQ